MNKYLAVFVTIVFSTVVFISFTWESSLSRLSDIRMESINSPTQTVTKLSPENAAEAATPLLTLFTTFKETPERSWIQMNTIMNWELFYPDIQPVTFMKNLSAPLAEAAREHRWIVLPVPAVNSHGTPFFKEMYYTVRNHTKSLFYSYANADILFTETLIDTLRAVNKTFRSNTTLVIGRRVNIVKNYTNEPPFYKPDEILDFAAKKGKLYRSDAEDYFAIGNIRNFPWSIIKDVVIGRPAYDNYVVAMACRYNVSVIDATNTIKAIHLSGGTKKFSGSNNKDRRYNFRVIGYNFPWGAGMTGSVPFYSKNDKKRGTIVILKRKKRC